MSNTVANPIRRNVDGLQNPKSYHRPRANQKKRFSWRSISWRLLLSFVVIGSLISLLLAPRVMSFSRQYELLDLLNNGRYLVLFQNDAEIRASGGFIGSFAIVETKNKVIKPLYFETNIYKLDDPYAALTNLSPPKPLLSVTGERGWALRDSNFAADFRQSAPTVAWFLKDEAQKLTGPKKAELDRALGGNYEVDGVVGLTLTAFLDILQATGPIEVPSQGIVVTSANFFPMIQQLIEKDYFDDPVNKQLNEPKTVLQDLFPLAMQKAQNLPKTTQYRIATKLLAEKKIIVYVNDPEKEQILVDAGWAGALTMVADKKLAAMHDTLAVVRTSISGNKSSIDINPIYRYLVTNKSPDRLQAKLEIQFEHTGKQEWPGGPNKEYIRVLVPETAVLARASSSETDVTDRIDIGSESGFTAFGFTIQTEPKTTQRMTIEYTLPKDKIMDRGVFGKEKYRLAVYRQPGGNSPDITILYNATALFQGRLTTDRVIHD